MITKLKYKPEGLELAYQARIKILLYYAYATVLVTFNNFDIIFFDSLPLWNVLKEQVM